MYVIGVTGVGGDIVVVVPLLSTGSRQLGFHSHR